MRRLFQLVAFLAMLGIAVGANASLESWLFSAGGGQIWFGATLPTLPTTFSTTSAPPAPGATCNGSYYEPTTGAQLQTDLNDAAAGGCANGDVIELQAGTTYTTTSSFNLPARSGSSTGWVYIISSDAPEIGGSGLPAAGTRVCPIASIGPSCSTTNTSLTAMASLRSSESGFGGPLLSRSTGAAYYRLVGLDLELIDANASEGNTYYVVEFNNGDTSVSTLAQHITIDRCYIDGSPSYGVTHAINLDGQYIEITESYFGTHVFQVGDADTNDIAAWNSIGPYRIYDNYLQAAGETTIFGGADTSLPSPSEPSDITETNNSFYKAYFVGTGSVTDNSTTLTVASVTSGYIQITADPTDANGYIPQSSIPTINAQLTGNSGDTCPATDCDGGIGTYQMSVAATGTSSGDVAITTVPSGKNMVEFKAGQRVLFESNYLENAGTNGQPRSAFVLTSRDQSGGNPWYALTDFTIENNFFGNCQFGGTNILLQDSPADGGDYDTYPADRILYRNNLFILSVNSGSSNTAIMSLGSAYVADTGNPSNIIFDHNTFIATPSNGANSWIGISPNSLDTVWTNFVWSNNIFDISQYGFENSSGTPTTWNGAFGSGNVSSMDLVFLKNVLTGANDSTIPSGNYEPVAETNVGYTSYGSDTAAAGYALTSSSAYHAIGVSGLGLPYNSTGDADGTDLGADISVLPTL